MTEKPRPDLTPRRVGAEMLLSAALGFVAFTLPVFLNPRARHYEAAFLPFVRGAVERPSLLGVSLLFAAGFAFGLRGAAPFALTGLATMGGILGWSIMDMIMGGDHNLFPLEWFMYGCYSLFGVAGGFAGRRVRALKI